MREILFKAKRLDNGEWVHGYIVRHPSAVQIGESSSWYIHVPPVDPDDNGGVFNVDPDTVCQYTGRTDKNGVKIFGHDRVRVKYTDCDEQREEYCTVHWSDDRCCFYPFGWEYYCDGCDCNLIINEIEVIGNIHDKED